MNNEEIINPDFSFWFPAEVEIEKAEGGKDVFDPNNMFLKGIASDESWDADGQSLKSEGLELDYLLSNGMINWHHMSKTIPSAVIGEPVEAKILKGQGLFLKAKLYNTETAIEAYKLANILKAQSKTRRLGWSIEGKILERDGNIIHKARLTGVALTPSPKNANTFAELCKAFNTGETTEKLLGRNYDLENQKVVIKTNNGIFEIQKGNVVYTEKALTVDGTGAALKQEDLEGSPKNVNMNSVLKAVLNKYPEITFQKALQVAKKIIENKSK